jgi:hypothetical protein
MAIGYRSAMEVLIRLNPADVLLLRDVVTQSLRALRSEIAHTDNREYRHALMARCDHLENLDQYLKGVDWRASA